MGCAASKSGEDDDVVSLCRDRKRLMKSAVDSRYALADAHCRYNHSLFAVAAAIRLFVARHSSPSSPFLITFNPASDPVVSNPMFLEQKLAESTQTESSDSSSESLKEVEEEEEGVEVCEHFYGGMGPQMGSPSREFGWDFFNPFFDGVVRNEVINNGFHQNSDDDLRVIREEEGIPELEEVVGERERGEKVGVCVIDDKGGDEGCVVVGDDDANVSQGVEVKGGLRVPNDGRELLEALKDVEDHFIRAHESGLDVSRMLETNKAHLQSGLEEIKENSNKLIQTITWHRSTSYQSSSCKSFLASSSKSSSTWTEFKNDLFDDYGGMEAGSHSLTLGRLYAWEKKLYEEVKAGDQTRKMYERKCSQLRNRDVRGDGFRSGDKTRAEVKDLHTRILVAIRSAESISKRIEKLRDEELQPQLVELLHGLMGNWKTMSESHKTQFRTMFEAKSFTCPTYGKFCNESHRLATLQLEAELQNWRSCFTTYFSAQKAYVESINGWLTKFIAPEIEFYSKVKSSRPTYQINGPPLLTMSHSWLSSIENLPEKTVSFAMKSFTKNLRALWVQQGEEQQQKGKVDGLAKELDRRVLAFQRSERKILESKLSEQKSDIMVRDRVDYLNERKDIMDMFKKRLENEREKHHDSMQETQRITLDGFQKGFSSIFESLAEFSNASVKMYEDLVTYNETGTGPNTSFIEETGSRVEVDDR